MKKLTCVLFIALSLFASQSFAMSLANRVPAVTGKVVSETGEPIAGALITVSFLATNDRLISVEEPEIRIVEKIETLTNDDGTFELKSTWINLPGVKSKFYGAEATISTPGYRTKKIQLINMRAVGGAIGIFLIGLIDAQGEDFNTPVLGTVAHAYKTVKSTKFSRVYLKVITEAPFVMKTGSSDDFDVHYNSGLPEM